MATYEYIVPPEYDGEMLQTFLRRGCGLSYRMVVKLKRVENGMTLDGKQWRSIDRVNAGQVVRLKMPDDHVRIEGADMPLAVVFEDEDILVVDKPPYLAVHPSAGKPEPTLANGVVAYFEQKGTPLSFRPVNRLDRDTSGIVLFAKHRLAAALLFEEWRTGRVEKSYLALTETLPVPACGTVELPIGRTEGSIIQRETRADGEYALTEYRALPSGLLLVTPKTGRTHQIRVHMAALGHPLLGDTLYGAPSPLIGRQALHALRLSFVHPMTGEPLTLQAPLPEDMKRARAALYPTKILEES